MTFAQCREDVAITCNATGNDYDLLDCPLGCQDGVGCRSCQPNETVCANGAVRTCDANGDEVAAEPCALGCFENEPRCRRVLPSNFTSSIFDMAKDGPVLDLASGSIDTNSGMLSPSVVVPSFLVSTPGAPSLRVFLVRSARLGNVQITGTNAFALAAEGPIEITGRVVVAPGVGRPAAGCNAGAGRSRETGSPPYEYAASASGGGGNGTAGGRGGSLTTTSTGVVYQGGSGGGVVGSDPLVPLQGGCGAGGIDGTVTVGAYPPPGDGGGAVQLVSQEAIQVSGVIDVRGPGGYREQTQDMLVVYGAGAGGSILLEAATVELGATGKLIAKGGGGGSEVGNATSNDTADADLGAPGSGLFGAGGNGAAPGVAASNGADVTRPNLDPAAGGGGGGGGLGRLRVNATSYVKHNSAVEAALTSLGMIQSR
ncbi:MAG: hypothetical protein AB7T06_06160 [Kofleriaceae bacterium]